MTDNPKTHIASRADLRAVLQRAGIARAAAEIVAKAGFAALVEHPHIDNEEDLTMSIQAMRERRAEKAASLQALVAKPGWNDARDKPKYDALMNEVEQIDIEMKRYTDANERLAFGASASVGGRAGGFSSGEDREHLAAFTNVLRNPKDMRAQQALRDMDFRNASSGITDPAGGFLIPEIILGPLMRRAVNVNPFRQLVRVVEVNTRDVSFPLSNSNSTTGWVAEMATRTATVEATLANAKPTFGTLYSYIESSEELVMDSVFDIGGWFAAEAGDKMGEVEMTSIISGDGTDKPSGLLRVTPTTGADGSRAAGVLKYLPTGNAATLGAAPSDLLISTIYDLKSAYRSNAAWVMNSAVAGEIRRLKDSQGRFLWTDSIAQGEPATLLGYPVYTAESMQGVGANNVPIMFGDFSRAYILCENGGLRVTLDDNVTAPGRVKWYIRRRLGGTVYDNDAVRAIRVSVA